MTFLLAQCRCIFSSNIDKQPPTYVTFLLSRPVASFSFGRGSMLTLLPLQFNSATSGDIVINIELHHTSVERTCSKLKQLYSHALLFVHIYTYMYHARIFFLLVFHLMRHHSCIFDSALSTFARMS